MKFLVSWVKSAGVCGESTIEGNSVYLDNGSLVIQQKILKPSDPETEVRAIFAPNCWSSCVEVKDRESDIAPLPEDPISFKEVDRNTLDREMVELADYNAAGRIDPTNDSVASAKSV